MLLIFLIWDGRDSWASPRFFLTALGKGGFVTEYGVQHRSYTITQNEAKMVTFWKNIWCFIDAYTALQSRLGILNRRFADE
jgi:hypothetical protein